MNNSLKAIGEKWQKLNKEYDDHIQMFLDNPDAGYVEDQVKSMKEMQKELFDLEERLFTFFFKK